MKIIVNHSCKDFDSFRAARIKSLSNVDTGANVNIEAELPLEDFAWSLGLVVGPAGSGKTSIGAEIFGQDALYSPSNWQATKPIIAEIAPDLPTDHVTAALAAVGLGTVPAWLQPDWIFDTATGKFSGRCLQRRPKVSLDIYETNAAYWSLFEPHHYLKLPLPIAATYYTGFVDNQPVAHVAFSPRPGLCEVRACRFVVMPEWQGMGVGLEFLNTICAKWRRGENRFNRPLLTLLNTSHPGLANAFRRSPMWVQVSAFLCGQNKLRSQKKIQETMKHGAGYGGHFRAIQGFRYIEGVGR